MNATGTGQADQGLAGQEMAARLAAARHLARHQVMGLTSDSLLLPAATSAQDGPPAPDRVAG